MISANQKQTAARRPSRARAWVFFFLIPPLEEILPGVVRAERAWFPRFARREDASTAG
jgi:hypothetical protein